MMEIMGQDGTSRYLSRAKNKMTLSERRSVIKRVEAGVGKGGRGEIQRNAVTVPVKSLVKFQGIGVVSLAGQRVRAEAEH